MIDLAACWSTLRYKNFVLWNQDNLFLLVLILHLLSLNNEMTYFLKEFPRKFILTVSFQLELSSRNFHKLIWK